MPRTIWLVHGYNVVDPRRLFRLADPLEQRGHQVRVVDYSSLANWLLFGLVTIRWATPREAERLATEVQPGDIGIGHSNGCAVLAKASELGAPFERLICMNAALRCDTIPDNPQMRRMYALHTPDDHATLLAEILRRLSPLRLFGAETPWGAMGRYGYTGDDPRAQNIDLRQALNVPQDDTLGHSGAYRWDRLDDLADLLTNLATRTIAD